MSVRATAMINIFKLWFGFRARVGRRAYALSGISLMALKYCVDAAVIFTLTGRTWGPLHYLSPFWTHRLMEGTVEASDLWVLGLWAVPFVWIGASMTARRALDAGLSAAWALLFFVPLVNYFLMLILCFARPEESEPYPDTLDEEGFRLNQQSGVAILVPALLGLALLSLTLKFSNGTYAFGLFLGGPFAIGFAAAFLYDRTAKHSFKASILIVQTSIAVLGGLFLLAGLEGLICLAMAYPLAGAIALLGGLLGQQMAQRRRLAGTHFAALLLLVPGISLLDIYLPSAPEHEVVTSIEIEAPPQEVWQHLVSFSELPEPGGLFFRLGIAYPRRARIEGHGIGAVRYCEFSTGPFVEPITSWEEPLRLSFDVIEQPPTMQERSPYKITPPHVTGSFHSRRGAFRLVPLDGGRTRLEGSTWYDLDLYPQFYWSIWSDWLLHGIHRQVLEHIKRQTEFSSL
ncbi:MAG: DUF805 domain-containing protein [Thermoanaerobaculia bacterium]